MEKNIPSLEVQFEHIADNVYLLDPQTSTILWCNRSAHEDLGFERNEILNQSVLSLQKDVMGQPQWQDIAKVIKSQSPFTFIGRHLHKSGSEIAVEVVTTHFQEAGQDYFLSVARNINKRLAVEKDMFTHNQNILFALNEASDGIWEWEVCTGTVFFSPQLKNMLGYGPEEMDAKISTWTDNIHPDDLDHVRKVLDEHLRGLRVKYDAEYRLKNRNGHYLWVHDKGKVCKRDERGEPTHVVGMVRNITDQKNIQFQLEALAANDVLTQLPNRREGERNARYQIALSERNAQPLCIALLDLDHFKKVNDLYGHQKGDEVLIFSANVLKKALRTTDFIYRWGGEEFVIIFPNTDIQAIRQVAEKLHKAFHNADWDSLGIAPMTFCIGVACFPYYEANFDTLFNRADTAVYLAKEQGRNRTIFSTDAEKDILSETSPIELIGD